MWTTHFFLLIINENAEKFNCFALFLENYKHLFCENRVDIKGIKSGRKKGFLRSVEKNFLS